MGIPTSTPSMINTNTDSVPQTSTQRHTPQTFTEIPPATKASRSQSVSRSPQHRPQPKTIFTVRQRHQKSASTTTVPTQYHVQTDRKLQDVENEHKKLFKDYVDLKTQTEQQQTLDQTRIKTLEAQLAELYTCKQQMEAKNKTIELLKNDASTTRDTIRGLKDDLATAQQTILSMTSIVDVNQKMPTVDELLVKFQSIRDQQHADICSTLKKAIKKQYPKWQKYYIAQLVHKVTFNGLIRTYIAVNNYKNTLYDKIADELNMKYAISKSMDGKNVGDIEGEIYRILSNMLGAYFKNNFECILKKNKVIDVVMESLVVIWKEMELNEWGESDIESVKLYIGHCCDICWIMMLQDPVLVFYPMEWECTETVVYNDEIHKKVLGSDRKTDKVLYYVWPAISRGTDICGNYKVDVLVKDAFYTYFKQKKRKPSERVDGKECKEEKMQVQDGNILKEKDVSSQDIADDTKEVEKQQHVETEESITDVALKESVVSDDIKLTESKEQTLTVQVHDGNIEADVASQAIADDTKDIEKQEDIVTEESKDDVHVQLDKSMGKSDDIKQSEDVVDNVKDDAVEEAKLTVNDTECNVDKEVQKDENIAVEKNVNDDVLDGGQTDII